MKLNVTTTPQSVFPDGHQDAITVTNTGTSDLYLDRTTAVSPTESLKLVPGSYIIWNAGAPLYLLSSHASGEATIVINEHILGRHADRKLALLLDGAGVFQNATFPPNSESGVILDISPYAGIIVQVQHIPGGPGFWESWILSGRKFDLETNPSLFRFQGYLTSSSEAGGPLIQTFYLPVDVPAILLESSVAFANYKVFGTNQTITEYAADWDSTYRFPFAPLDSGVTADYGLFSNFSGINYVRIIKPMRRVHVQLNPATADIANNHRLTLNLVTGKTSGLIRQYHYMKPDTVGAGTTTEVHAVFVAPRFTASSISQSGVAFSGINATFQAEY